MKDFIKNNLYTKQSKLNPNAAKYEWWQKREFDHQYNELMRITSFLNDNALLSERVHCVLNDITEPVLCEECKTNPVKWQKQTKQYGRFCSLKCKSNNKSVQEKTNQTNLKKYGSENPFGSDEVKSKIKNTNLERYGDTSPARTDSIRHRISQTKHNQDQEVIKQKREATMLSRHGYTNPFNSNEVQIAAKETIKDRYGVDNIMCLKETKQKILNTNRQRYNADHYSKTDEYKERFRIKSLKRYNTIHPAKSDAVKEKTKQTQLDRYGCLYTQTYEHRQHLKNLGNPNQFPFSADTRSKLNDYDWMYHQYVTLEKTSYMIGDILDINPTAVIKALRRHNIPIQYTYNSSGAEFEIGKEIESFYSGDVIYSDRFIIAPFELDIVIPDKQVAIEYCGLYWHSDRVKEDSYYHKQKMDQCNLQGYRLITIFEDEWLYSPERVISLIKNVLDCNDSDRVYARSCVIDEVESKEFRQFLSENHLQGAQNCSIRLGLYYSNTLVAVLGFRRLETLVFDLNRYATFCKVIGGFSKLLSYFKKHYQWNKIITFADRRYSEGNMYLQSGFTHVYNTAPQYFYVKGDKKFSRNRFMKHKLHKELEHFDPDMTEYQNMQMNGYSRIYDCGHMKFEMTND